MASDHGRRSITRAVLLAAATATLLSTASAQADWLVPTELGETGVGSYPVTTAVNASGDAFAMALRASDGALVWRFRPAGGAWTAAQALGSGARALAAYGRVPATAAIDGAGNVRVVWTTSTQVRTAYKAATSADFAGIDTLSTAAADKLADPHIATNTSGKTFIAWANYANATGAKFRWVDAPSLAGPLSTESGIQTYDSADYFGPITLRVSVAPNGAVGVAWSAAHGSGPFPILELLGTARGPDQTDFFSTPQAPASASSSGLGQVDTFNMQAVMTNTALTAVYAQGNRVVASSRTWSVQGWTTPPDLASSCTSPAIDADVWEPAITVAWTCEQSGSFGRVQTATASNSDFSAPVTLRTNGDAARGADTSVRVVAGAGGRALIVWRDEAEEHVYSSQRAALDQPFGPATAASPSEPDRRPIAVDGDAAGDAVAVLGKYAASAADQRSFTALFDPNPPTLTATIPGKATAGSAETFAATGTEAFSALDGLPKWDFGDGSSGAGDSVKHTFDKAGTYTVEVTVKDAGGNAAKKSAAITVAPGPGGGGGGGDGKGGDGGKGTGPGGDSTAPAIVLPRSVRRSGRTVLVRLLCPKEETRCAGPLRLTTRKPAIRRLTAKRFAADGGKAATVRLRLTRTSLRRLVKAKGLATLRLTVTDAAGNRATAVQDVVVKRKRKA